MFVAAGLPAPEWRGEPKRPAERSARLDSHADIRDDAVLDEL